MEIEKSKTPKEPMILSSRKKWFWVWVMITFFNPLIGLVCSIAVYREELYKKEGRVLIASAIIWMFIIFLASSWLSQHGYIYQKGYLPQSIMLPIVK